MPRYVAEIERSNIAKVQLYINKGRKSLSQIKKETGADYLVNAGFFEFGSFKQLIHVKADWVTHATDKYTYFGYAWNNPDDFKMRIIPTESTGCANHLAVCEMINGNKPVKMIYNSDVGGARPRSAIGTKGTKICLFAQSTNITPDQLQSYALSQGWDSAVMLDGGGSTQCDFNGQKILSSREVANLILIYTKKADPIKPPTGNPYPVPTRVLKRGVSGDDVRWVQYQINRSGIVCGIDGSFGPATENAVRMYQKARGLAVDGSVGPATRSNLLLIK